MTIIDRARDALNKATPGPWGFFSDSRRDGTKVHRVGSEETGEDVFAVLDWGYAYQERNVRLAALAPELAAEVVRLHDELCEIADEWEADAEYQHKYMGSSEAEASEAAAARIRAVIERSE